MIDDFEDYMRHVRAQRRSQRSAFWSEFFQTLLFVALFAVFLCAFHAAAPKVHAFFFAGGAA